MYCFFYKVLNGHTNIDLSPFIQFFSHSEKYSLRGRDELTLKKNYARTDTFKFSYFNRIVDMWNMAHCQFVVHQVFKVSRRE